MPRTYTVEQVAILMEKAYKEGWTDSAYKDPTGDTDNSEDDDWKESESYFVAYTTDNIDKYLEPSC